MTTIKIDNVDYDTDKLSDEAKAHLASIQFCDQELQRLQVQAAGIQTARMAYAKALQSALPTLPQAIRLNSTNVRSGLLGRTSPDSSRVDRLDSLLDEAAYLHICLDTSVIEVVGLPKPEMQGSSVLWVF